jgi:hypothetical protein
MRWAPGGAGGWAGIQVPQVLVSLRGGRVGGWHTSMGTALPAEQQGPPGTEHRVAHDTQFMNHADQGREGAGRGPSLHAASAQFRGPWAALQDATADMEKEARQWAEEQLLRAQAQVLGRELLLHTVVPLRPTACEPTHWGEVAAVPWCACRLWR